MERRHFARNLNFTALLNPSDAKRQLLLVATFDQVEVAHFKNLKWQHPIGKHTLRKGEERNGLLHFKRWMAYFLRDGN